MTGQIGRPGTGLHPLRGQNNVQGASDAGPDPDDVPRLPARLEPGGARALRERLGAARGNARREARPDGGRGDARDQGRHRSAACTSWARTRRCPTPTRTMRARRSPRSSTWSCRTSSSPRPPTSPTSSCRRARSPRRPAPSPTPTASCRSAARRSTRPATRARTSGSSSRSRKRLGLRLARRRRCRAVFDEMRHTMPSIAGITWERLEREHAVTYPCTHEGDPGDPVVFIDNVPARRRPRRGSCRPTSSRPTSAPMPSTRWC